jgi:hypothetical protein
MTDQGPTDDSAVVALMLIGAATLVVHPVKTAALVLFKRSWFS